MDSCTRFRVTLSAFTVLALSAHSNIAGALDVASSLGPGKGQVVSSEGASGDCGNQSLLLNSDSTYENAYAWQYNGVLEPNYGAFAECYSASGTVCSLVFDLTSIWDEVATMDTYVWEDAGGVPGTVISLETGIEPGPIARWPSVSRHEFAMTAPVEGPFWVGEWGNWPLGVAAWWIAADLDGGGPGCSSTNVVPGDGWPSGWQNVSVVWEPTRALGIGLRLEGEPTPVRENSWGEIRGLFR